MAKMKNGILGGFSGKIGNVVGVEHPDGTYSMRSVPEHVKNPQSEAQQTGRIGLGLCSGLVKVILPFAEQGFGHLPYKSVRGAFVSKNSRTALGGVYPDLHIDYRFLKVAVGQLLPAREAAVECNDQGDLEFFWDDNSGEGGAKENDRVMLLVINPAKKDCQFTLKGNSRADGSDVLEIPSGYEGDTLHAYIAFASKNGYMVSDSVYLPL